MVDDEGISGELGGGEAEAKAVDVPVGERVGIIGGNDAFGQLRVRVFDPIQDEVIATSEASAIQYGVASGVYGQVLCKVPT